MPASIENTYFIKMNPTTETVCFGQLLGFVSPNFVLVQYHNPETHEPFSHKTIIGIPHLEDVLLFDTLSEVLDAFQEASECDEEGQ